MIKAGHCASGFSVLTDIRTKITIIQQYVFKFYPLILFISLLDSIEDK